MAVKLERRIGIQAPDEIVWELLSDVPGWATWNPLYPRAEGEIRIGHRWDLDLALPGQTLRTIKPVILDWAPYDHIHWRLDMMRGWMRTVRFLEIEKMGEENVIFSNGEIFDGWLGPSAARRLRRPILDGFEALNEALKARAEAIWAERK
ncbi:MAG: SRPBCC domain-containing protein [Caulobacter sp.]|nr:SRPBCC domain-containing protein [Caulobacter sp.]